MAWKVTLDAPSYEVVLGENLTITGTLSNDHGASNANREVDVGDIATTDQIIHVKTDEEGKFTAVVETVGWAKDIFAIEKAFFSEVHPKYDPKKHPAGQYWTLNRPGTFDFVVRYIDPDPNTIKGRVSSVSLGKTRQIKVWRDPPGWTPPVEPEVPSHSEAMAAKAKADAIASHPPATTATKATPMTNNIADPIPIPDAPRNKPIIPKPTVALVATVTTNPPQAAVPPVVGQSAKILFSAVKIRLTSPLEAPEGGTETFDKAGTVKVIIKRPDNKVETFNCEATLPDGGNLVYNIPQVNGRYLHGTYALSLSYAGVAPYIPAATANLGTVVFAAQVSTKPAPRRY